MNESDAPMGAEPPLDELEAALARHLRALEQDGSVIPPVDGGEVDPAVIADHLDLLENLAERLTGTIEGPSDAAVERGARALEAALAKRNRRRFFRLRLPRLRLWVFAGTLGFGLSLSAAFASNSDPGGPLGHWFQTTPGEQAQGHEEPAGATSVPGTPAPSGEPATPVPSEQSAPPQVQPDAQPDAGSRGGPVGAESVDEGLDIDAPGAEGPAGEEELSPSPGDREDRPGATPTVAPKLTPEPSRPPQGTEAPPLVESGTAVPNLEPGEPSATPPKAVAPPTHTPRPTIGPSIDAPRPGPTQVTIGDPGATSTPSPSRTPEPTPDSCPDEPSEDVASGFSTTAPAPAPCAEDGEAQEAR